jgi:hypothetical protein
MVMHSLVQNCSPIGPSLRWCRGEGRVRWGWGGNGLKWPVYFLFSRSSVTKSLTPMPYSSLPRAWQGLLWVKHVAPKKIRNILLPYTALKGLTHAGPTGPWIHIRRPRARGQWELGPCFSGFASRQNSWYIKSHTHILTHLIFPAKSMF